MQQKDSNSTAWALMLLLAIFLQVAFVFADATDTPARAAVDFSKAYFRLDPAMADAVRRRGDCHYLLVPVLSDDVQVYYDRALADYEAAIEIEPDVYTYNAHAAILASLGKLEQAIEEYEEAIALDPAYPESYFNRGYAYKRLGKIEKAVADFRKYLSFERHWNEEMVAQAESHIRELTEAE